jgi:hypothetical protein
MRPLRYSINVTLVGCCDHRAIGPSEEIHRYATEIIARADALLFGRVTYGMMEAAWRPKWVDLRLVGRKEFGSGAVAMRYEARRKT